MQKEDHSIDTTFKTAVSFCWPVPLYRVAYCLNWSEVWVKSDISFFFFFEKVQKIKYISNICTFHTLKNKEGKSLLLFCIF